MFSTIPLRHSVLPQTIPLCFILTGFLPVMSIVLHCTGVLSLQHCALFLILPLVALSLILGLRDTGTGRVALRGWVAGIFAVALYDLSRLPFLFSGWSDFIPKIGGWLAMEDHPVAWLGYLWRYIGNGGGLGMVYFILLYIFGASRYFLRSGLAFGLFVFVCLQLVLLTFDEAQAMMFPLNWLTFSGSLTGHVVYGLSLGWVGRRGVGKRK
ncbi:MAG TPA: hypothetical protein VI757_02370 [Bacteroidia bacterium]|nr:hypothetical protein [Bacteroidia bacterium]